MSKKLLNSPDECVDEFIAGLITTHKNLIQLPGHRVILRKDLHNLKGKVAVLSGGGSGHEPAHAGYVGRGMLTGAICGAIFTSPPASAIFAAIKAVHLYEPKGVLLIVTNYTGDRVNFGLAREWAMNEGIRVETVVVGEDCALTSPDRSAGRRGLAGTILVHKIAGALSDEGESIEQMVETLEEVTRNMGTIGICLKPCVLPGSTSPSFNLAENEMGLGLGVHGEAGVKNVQMRTSSETVNLMLDHMMDKKSDSHIELSKKDEIVLMVNNLGGTTNLEIGIITNDVIKTLSGKGIRVVKIFSGAYVTSLEMAGFSITILKISKNIYSRNISILHLLEKNADTPCILKSGTYEVDKPQPDLKQFEKIKSIPIKLSKPEINVKEAALFQECLVSSCKALIAITDKLNEFDRGSGDGDCGSTHARGVEGILKELKSLDFRYPADAFQSIGLICCENMGGTSGGMYSVLFAGIARFLSTKENLTVQDFAMSLHEGLSAVVKYGGAKPGDRTMLDVLKPISDKLNDIKHLSTEALEDIQALGVDSANKTKHMQAKSGRSSYVSLDLLINPDPGAIAVAEIINAVSKVLKSHLQNKQFLT